MEIINDITIWAKQFMANPEFSQEMIIGLIIFLVVLFMLLVWRQTYRNKYHLKNAITPSSNIIGADTTTYLKNEINNLKERQAQIDTEMAYLEKKVKGIFRTAIVRYNPFKDSGTGGLQSFSTALIDEHGTGLILTHLFSREMSRVQVKNITTWQADQELSPEEKQVLAEVKGNSNS